MKVTAHLVNFDDPVKRQALILQAKQLRGWHRIGLEKHHDERTLSQNNYYFGVVLDVVSTVMTEGTGDDWDLEGAHLFCKMSWLPTRTLGGVKMPVSTKTLDTREMGEYIDKIILWLNEEIGVEVPAPRHK